MYPYGLRENPFRHAIPTPDVEVAQVLGGSLWQDAKNKLIQMIQNTREYILNLENDFALGTVVGQTGSGKTHLLLNIQETLPDKEFDLFYTDLTSYTYNRIGYLLGEIVSAWNRDILEGLRRKTVNKLKKKAETGNKAAERILLGGPIDKVSFMLKQRDLDEVVSKIISGKRDLNFKILEEVNFSSPLILEFLRKEDSKILENGFKEGKLTLKDFKFLVKALNETGTTGVILLDELGSIANEERRTLLNEIKGLINQRPPLILLFASTPGGLTDLEEIDPPFTRRVAKPRVRCDINVPRSYKEVFDVIKTYFEEFNAVLSKENRRRLEAIIKELFNQGMKTLGDLLPIINSALKESRGEEEITIESIQNALENTRLGLNSPKSEMGTPLGDYLRISTKISKTPREVAKTLERSLREILFQAGKLGKISYLDSGSKKINLGNGNAVYSDIYLETERERISLNIRILDDKYLSQDEAQEVIKIAEEGKVDGNKLNKVILLSNMNCSKELEDRANLHICILDKSDIIDIIYLANYRVSEGPEQLKEEINNVLKKLGIKS